LLWQRDAKGQTWELIFALDELRTFDIAYAEMNQVVGYDEKNGVQGFTVLTDARSAALFDFLGLDSDLHPASPSEVELADLLAHLDGETDLRVTAARRLEQGFLRRLLLPGETGNCVLCGDELPVQFLVAAHIKKRAFCTHAERTDMPAIAMVACKFGCDALFEDGLLGVNEHGNIVVSPLAPVSLAGVRHLRRYVGRRLTADMTASTPYFAWHWAHTFKDVPS